MPLKTWRTKLSRLLAVAVGLCTQAATAQTSFAAHDARSSAMGGCLVPDTGSLHLSVGYSQPFLLPELAEKRVALGSPTGSIGHLLASYSHHGNSDYHCHQASASYRLRVADWLQAGAGIAFFHTGSANPYYTPTRWIAGEALLMLAPRDAVRLTLAAGSPEQRGAAYRWLMQVAYKPSPRFATLVEAERHERWRLRTGIAYNYRNCFFVRAGIATAPLSPTFGIGVRKKHIGFDIGSELHSSLGLTPHTSLTLWL